MVTNAEALDYLREVVDPDLGLPLVELGLIYRVEAFEDRIEVDFTLTSPACPVGDLIQEDIKNTLISRTGMDNVAVNLVWEPMWTKDMMSEELKLTLGIPI